MIRKRVIFLLIFLIMLVVLSNVATLYKGAANISGSESDGVLVIDMDIDDIDVVASDVVHGLDSREKQVEIHDEKEEEKEESSSNDNSENDDSILKHLHRHEIENEIENEAQPQDEKKTKLTIKAKKRKLRVITYADRVGFKFCSMVASALANDIDLTILGWNNPDSVGKDSLFQKLAKTSQYLKELGDDDGLVVFVDGFDVYFSGGEKEILSGYKKARELRKARIEAKAKTPTGANANANEIEELLFTGELGCWPYMYAFENKSHGQAVCDDIYPESPTKYRYLNSGGWMGPIREARKLFTRLNSVLEMGKLAGDDQQLVSDFYIYHRNASIMLDHTTEVFMSLHRHKDREVWSASELPTYKIKPDGRLYNTVNKNYPAVVHFNGGAKDLVTEVEKKMKIPEKVPKLRGKPVNVQISNKIVQHKFEDICPFGLSADFEKKSASDIASLSSIQKLTVNRTLTKRPPSQELESNLAGCMATCKSISDTCIDAKVNGTDVKMLVADERSTCDWLLHLHCKKCPGFDWHKS